MAAEPKQGGIPIGTSKRWLKALSFQPADGETDTFIRSFPLQGMTIRVSLGNGGNIDFGEEINKSAGRATTRNLSQQENLVVLECVCRLLEQGYAPSSITLEKSYRINSTCVYLDILVSREGKAFMMIECKTAGAEFKAELAKLGKDGGQLLSYYVQDRGVSFLCLYSSDIDAAASSPKAEYAALETNELSGSDAKEIFESWTGKTFSSGLFDARPYQLKELPLTVAHLEEMVQSDGGRIFNAFEETLRRNVISDKANAFNKIFNLFICKVQDEEKTCPEEVLDFQWMADESAETVLNRLNDLYKKGLKSFLSMDVVDHSLAEVERKLASLSEADKAALRKVFNDLRLFRNNEFAFIEVFDRDTFEQNAEVVKSVVRLLQRKKLRYSEKQQFMGDFFERLLNMSVKQESGQFFTPLPIARFICDALPFENIISLKVEEGLSQFLPTVIDYASGSGHFLTEAMDRIDKALKDRIAAGGFKTRTQKDQAVAWSGSGYKWAKDSVYGIEKDYRLAKTTKVSCFLNGDGEANIVRGDGLGHFHLDEAYRKCGGSLWRHDGTSREKDIGTFDIVVANPPYSVKQFKTTVKNGDESFELFSRVSPDSKEIEAMFLERTKHLLKKGGVAGVVFPISLLSTGGIFLDVREMLLKYFHIVAMAALGPSTFMKTGTGTVVLFLERRANNDWVLAEKLADQFFSTKVDGAAFGNTNAFSTYAKEVHGASVADYCSALSNSQAASLPIFRDYQRIFREDKAFKKLAASLTYKSAAATEKKFMEDGVLMEYVGRMEKKRLSFFLLTLDRKTVVVNAPDDKKAEQEFLGYEFSERMGNEGMRFLSGTEKIETPLFDPDQRSNPQKISTVIRSMFEGKPVSVPASLGMWCEILPTHTLLDFKKAKQHLTMSTRKPSAARTFAVTTEKLGVLCDVCIGKTPPRKNMALFKGTNLWLSVGEMQGDVVTDTKEKITNAACKAMRKVSKGTVLMSFKLSIGKLAIAGCDLYTNEAIAALPIKNPSLVDSDFLFSILSLFPAEILRHKDKGNNKFGKSLNRSYLEEIDIPLLPQKDRAFVVSIFQDTTKTHEEKRQAIAHLIWV